MHNKKLSESHLTVQIHFLLNTNQPEQSITYNLLLPSLLGTFTGSLKISLCFPLQKLLIIDKETH